MKKHLYPIVVLALCAGLLAGCAQSTGSSSAASSQASVSSSAETADTANTSEKAMPELLPAEDCDPEGGADAYGNAGDHADSIYYVNPDFYNMESNDHLTILTGFKTMQQTTEYSCGAASAYMVLSNWGITDYTEWDLCQLAGVSVDEDTEEAQPGSADNYYEYGAHVGKLVKAFNAIEGVEVLETSYREDWTEADLLTEADGVTGNDVGNLPGNFSSSSLYASENSDDTEAWVDDASDSYFVSWITGHLEQNHGILVEWGDWDGHWQVIIGYDTMGTPSIGDDMIIFADPYDTSDHWQDGYYYYPAERWFYMWKDRCVSPKPFQLQPYVVVGLTEES
ncbi:MAG: C39 family peptidase [Pygmaiobacter massiliensis]|nr:C39 family peptidase [Pygmaiobacter massiliensis]